MNSFDLARTKVWAKGPDSQTRCPRGVSKLTVTHLLTKRKRGNK